MKRILSIALALAMIMSLLVVSSFAATTPTAEPEGIYYASDSKITEDTAGNVIPGDTIYVAICEYVAKDEGTQVKKASITADDTDYKTILANDSSVDVVRLKDGAGNRWNFAKLKLKTISASTYDDDGPDFEYYGELKVKFEDGSSDELDVAFTATYEEEYVENSEFTENLKYFTYEKGDEFEIESEDGDLVLTGTASGSGKAVAAVDTDTIDSIEEKYGDDASLGYFACTGSFSRVKNGKLTISGSNTYRYCYGYSNGKLVNIDAKYSSKNDEFTIEFDGSTVELGTYVLSDKKLSASGTASASTTTETSSSTSTSSSASSSSSSSVVNPNYIPANPSTGAIL